MQRKDETKQERLARLEDELQQLKSTLPEHCYGREGYISIHHATPEHWQKIEDIEEEIKELKAELKPK
jgi:HPt (histidine-containing phosphotransfer) domain-containing protein